MVMKLELIDHEQVAFCTRTDLFPSTQRRFNADEGAAVDSEHTGMLSCSSAKFVSC